MAPSALAKPVDDGGKASGGARQPDGNAQWYRGMTDALPKTTLKPRPMRVGSKWHVVLEYKTGQTEQIPGFNTEADAERWIASPSARVWLRQRLQL
jgi:hypothetical protein